MSSQTARAAKLLKLDSTEDATILVGTKKKRFTIPRALLTQRSTFFKAALDGNFKEAKDRKVSLPEADADMFAIYVQFIYTGGIVLLEPEEIEQDTTGTARYYAAARLYILADQLGDLSLQNKVIDYYNAVMDSTSSCWAANTVSLVYSSLPESSPLRKFVVAGNLMV